MSLYDNEANEEKLGEIAKKAPNPLIRQAAIEKLTDISILIDLAQNDSRADTRLRAINMLGHRARSAAECQTLFERTAIHEPDNKLRLAAVCKLDNQNLLKQIAKNDNYEYIRLEAVKRLTDQSVLEYIAKNDLSFVVRDMAIERLTDQSALEHIARNETARSLRKKALEKIQDENLKREIKSSPLSEEQKKHDADMDRHLGMIDDQREQQSRMNQRMNKGCCPHCGAKLTGWESYVPRASLKENRTHTYICGACGKTI